MILSKQIQYIPLVLLVVLATWFFYPILFLDKSIVHGDNLHFGYALMDLLSQALHGETRLVWTNLAYGGHPLFAEGQGAFANPLNILIAWFFPPIVGHNVLHWMSMIIGGLGTFALCRNMGLSPLSSGFAALGVSFSSLFIGAHTNMIVSGAMAWIPWAMCATEVWLKAPSLKSSALLGIAITLLIVAGYPHILHGTIIYLVVSLCVIPFQSVLRKKVMTNFRRYLFTGAFAVLVCIGLAAIQWLPLLELAQYSHRKDGIDIGMQIEGELFYRGAIFSLTSTEPVNYFPVVGSLFICVMASLVLLLKTKTRAIGHLLAALFLFQLGLASASPVFRFVYDYNLIPGMHNFRLMFIYFYMSVVGICVASAFALEALSQGQSLRWRKLLHWKNSAWIKFGIFGILILCWGWVSYYFHIKESPTLNYVVALMGVPLLLAAAFSRWRFNVPVAALILLLVEVVYLRLEPYYFVDNKLLEVSKSVDLVKSYNDWREYKHLDVSHAKLITFRPPYSHMLDSDTSKMVESIGSASNFLWNISSFDGSFALPLYRKKLLDSQVRNEIEGESDREMGSRLIDILGIRFVTLNEPVETEGFKIISLKPEIGLAFMENEAALPRFRLYQKSVFVDDVDQAFEKLKSVTGDVLVVESSSLETIGENHEFVSNGDMKLEVRSDDPMDYQFEIQLEVPGWLFISDANYPGWFATIDGEEAAVYSAQVLGKAVRLSAGSHSVRVYFESRSFIVGRAISLVTLVSLIFLFALLALKKVNKSLVQADVVPQP